MTRLSQEFSNKLEDMLVVPFMVILYTCMLVPLSILSYQGYSWLRTGEWKGLTLNYIAEQIKFDLSALHGPGWTGVKNIFSAFLEWPLVLSTVTFLFVTGWLLILIFSIFVRLVMNNQVNDESVDTTPG